MIKGKIGQAWYMDFVVAVIVFSIMIVIYFIYLPNVNNQELNAMDDIYLDSQFIVESLMTPGLPYNWTAVDVIKIGVVSNGSYLNETLVGRFKNFANADYDSAKNLLGIRSEFVVFFVDTNGNLRNINGTYYIGESDVNYESNASDLNLAYYYRDTKQNYLFNHYDNNNFNINVDEFNTSVVTNLNTISDYDFIIMESPELTDGSPDQQEQVEDYVYGGGNVFISDKMFQSGTNLFGVRHSQESSGTGGVTVTALDQYLDLEIGDTMNCSDGYAVDSSYVGDPNASNFQILAEYDNSGETAIASWEYGNGTVYYFCNFQTEFNNGGETDFQYILYDASERFVQINHFGGNISMENVQRDNVVKMIRLVNYKGEPISMVVYAWE